MKKKNVMAAVLSLVMVFGAAGSFAPVGGVFDTAVSASAEETGSVTLDESTGVLTLNGHITAEMVEPYRDNEKVLSVASAEGCVFPEDSTELLSSLKYAKTMDLSKADTSNVTVMNSMFHGCLAMEHVDLSGFDTSKVTDMSFMFDYCTDLRELDLSNFETPELKYLSNTFYNCPSLESVDLSSFNTSNVLRTDGMFYGDGSLTVLDLSNFDTPKLEDMSHMFEGCSGLKTIYASENFTPASGGDDNTVFEGCIELVGGNGTKYLNSTDIENAYKKYAVIDKEGQPGYFTYKEYSGKPVHHIILDETTGVLTLAGRVTKAEVDLFMENEKVTKIDTDGSCVLPEDCSFLFHGGTSNQYWKNLKSIDLSKADSSNVKNMAQMFGYLPITSIDLSDLDTSNVNIMNGMFQCCQQLTSIDLSSFDTSNVTKMRYMFFGDSKLETIYVSEKWSTEKLEDADALFSMCESIKGGNGTTYDWKNISSDDFKTYARIDKPGQKGYLTDKNYVKPAPALGDISGDGAIDVEDAVMVIGHVNGNKALTDDEAKYADVDKNGVVDIEDAVAIIAHVNGIKSID